MLGRGGAARPDRERRQLAHHHHHHQPPTLLAADRKRTMTIRRDIYLRIEVIPGYSPVNPDDDEANSYKRDCLRSPGHADGAVPDAEVEMRRFDALVYREYLDAGYTSPNMAPMVAADINEPRADRRVPSTVIYTEA